MALPDQVRKQSEAITQLYAELNSEKEAAPAADTPVDPAAAASADSATVPEPESGSDEQGTSDTTADVTADQRYRTLQGMYNADTARLRGENQQLNGRLTQLETLLSSLTAKQEPPATRPAEKLVTTKDIEEYGDSIEVMRRVTKEETAATNSRIAELEETIRSLQTTIVPRVEQVAQKQAVSQEQAFWSELTGLVPEWRDINNDKRFHGWLLEVDPLTGLSRQSYLEDAQKVMDARRVSNFFTAWQSISGPPIAQPPRDAVPSPLEKQVTPGRGRSNGAAPVPPQPIMYSPKDIAKFFDDVRRGLYKGREEERDRIERDIIAAPRENRVVANG